MEKTAFIQGKMVEKEKPRLLGGLPPLPGMEGRLVKPIPSYSQDNKDFEIQGRKKYLKKKKTKTDKRESLSNQLDNLLDELGFDTEVVKEPSKDDKSIAFEEKTKRRRGEAMTNSTSSLPCITPQPKKGQLEPLTNSLKCSRTSESCSVLGKTQDILSPHLPDLGVKATKGKAMTKSTLSSTLSGNKETKGEEESSYSWSWNRPKPPSDDEESVIEEIIEGQDLSEDKKSMSEGKDAHYSSDFEESLHRLSNDSDDGASRLSKICSTNEDTTSEEEINYISPLSGPKKKTMREPGRTVKKVVFLEREESEESKKALLTQLPPLKGMTPRPKRVQLEPLTPLKGPCPSGFSSFLTPLPVLGVQSSQSDAGLPERTSELVENSTPTITKDRLSSTSSSNKETKSMEESHNYLPLNKSKQPSDSEGRVIEEVTEEGHLVEQESGEDLLKDQTIATHKACLSPSHLKSSRSPPHNLSASFGRESAEISICHSGLSQDAELSNHSEINEDMQQNIKDPVEEEKEALMKEKQKRLQEFQDALHRQEEEEERLLKAESEKRLKALRQSVKARRRKEESKLTKESDKNMMELKESLRANEKEQDLRLRQESNALLDQIRTGIALEQERKIIKLKAQKHKEIQEQRAELLQLKEAHQREMDSITEKHKDEMTFHKQQLQSRFTEEKEQLQASHSRELEKLNIKHQLNIEKMQKENSVKQSQLQEQSKALELRESQLKNIMVSLQSQENALAEKRKCFASTEEDVDQQIKHQLKKEQDRAKEESDKVKAERQRCDIEQKDSKEEPNSLETQVKLISLRLSELEANFYRKASEKPGPNRDPTLVLEDLETPLSFPADHRTRCSSKSDWNVSSCADAIQSNKVILENSRRSCQQREASSTLNTGPANQVLSHTPLCQSGYSTPLKHSAREVNNQRPEDVINSNNRFQSYYQPPNVLPSGGCLIQISLDHNNDVRVYHGQSAHMQMDNRSFGDLQ